MKCSKDLSVKGMISGDEEAVAELIGALLLTAVIAVVIGMLAIVVFSGTSAVETPALRVSTVDGNGNINLLHQGGDTLSRETTQILVDGADRTDDFETPEGDPWITFSVGDILESSLPCTEGTVIQIVSTDSRNPTVIESLTCGPGIPAPVANFTSTPASGYAPLEVSFEDLSTGDPTFWSWDFGDNTSSALKNPPVHTYNNSSTYSVTLTACNEGGCNSTTINVTVFGFSDFVTNESVFVYGTKLDFKGDTIVGENSTVIITGDILSGDLNGNAKIYVSNIYVNGSVELSGSQYLGSTTLPGLIYITDNLDLTGNSRVYGDEIYVGGNVVLYTGISGVLYTDGDLYFNNGNIDGEAHVKGDLHLNGGHVSDDIYVDGNVVLAEPGGWCPNIDNGVSIYYTGSLSNLGGCSNYILNKCHPVASVPDFSMPVFLEIPIPDTRSEQWYDNHNYVNTSSLVSGIKIYDDNSYSTVVYYYNSAENIVIVSGGDINIYVNQWAYHVTGVLFAPYGRVTFHGSYFEGVVIARDGFYVDYGTDVEFRNIANYISDPEDYPFGN
ncbi:PKD domain-containing protein [Methanolacinia paynteri]|uniref:PKD domain-containing protein n=1 Tax=Methanolacinia paynteri TaxID=230356 RepID=UPI000A018C26|nr:PKD domain-containing protein [Methanolacinia paynteri]